MAFVRNFPTPSPAQAFELKGRMMTLSVLRVLTADLDALGRQLDAKIAAAPALFRNFPVLLDVEALPEDVQSGLDIARLDRLLRSRDFIPVGIRAGGPALTQAAARAGIGVVSASATQEPQRRERIQHDARDGAVASLPNLLIREPVRSGQQIYAKGGDLIVLAAVSPGAEILADGNIHIYASLRGRALAGVCGNTEARIFCHSLDAQLVSIAGHYRLSDNIRLSRQGEPVQIFLNGDSLVIEAL